MQYLITSKVTSRSGKFFATLFVGEFQVARRELISRADAKSHAEFMLKRARRRADKYWESIVCDARMNSGTTHPEYDAVTGTNDLKSMVILCHLDVSPWTMHNRGYDTQSTGWLWDEYTRTPPVMMRRLFGMLLFTRSFPNITNSHNCKLIAALREELK